MLLPFTKMHGLGNDFVVIDSLNRSAETKPMENLAIPPELARQLCDRRLGVGADQVLWLKRPKDPAADTRMEIINADGSPAEMCGNGIRAAALYMNRYGPRKKLEYRIETLAGILPVKIRNGEVSVEMGVPKLGPGAGDEAGFKAGEPLGEIIEALGQSLRFHEVNVGNPHAVIFVGEVAKVPLEKLGPVIETHVRFPQRTNVEFVEIENPTSIRVRVWERGAGATLACGTGACAAAAAAIATGRARSPLEVHLPGGRLRIFWEGTGKTLVMEGPAVEVFRGEAQI